MFVFYKIYKLIIKNMIENKLKSNFLLSTTVSILVLFILISIFTPFNVKAIEAAETEDEAGSDSLLQETAEEEAPDTTNIEEKTTERAPEETLGEVDLNNNEEEKGGENDVDENAAGKEKRGLSEVQNQIQTRMEEHRENFEDVTNLSVRERIAEKHQEMLQKKEESRKVLQGEAKEKVKNGIERMVNQLSRVLESLEKISDKIEARVETLEKMGADVEESLNLLAEAKVSLENSRTYIEVVSEELLNITEGETSAQEIRANIGVARENLNETRQDFVKVIISLKKTRAEVENNE